MTDFGIMFRREQAPEALPDYARRVEAAGFDELWLVEDCFYASGIASVATALAVTERVRVGLGIAPAVLRNAALLAMEVATLARLHPGRVVAGIGHGVREWMQQIGALPPSQLAALEEVTQSVSALLRGETLHLAGRTVTLDDVTLEFPPTDAPPVLLGVHGPKSLRVAGRVADGTLLSEGSSPPYVRWAREQVAAGRAEAGRQADPQRVTLYVWTMLGEDRAAMRDVARQTLAPALPHIKAQLTPLGIYEEVQRLAAAHGAENLAAHIPDEWLDQLSVSGTLDDGAAAVARFVEAGVDSVVFVTPPEYVEPQFPWVKKLLALARE